MLSYAIQYCQCVLLRTMDWVLGGEELTPLAERGSFVRHNWLQRGLRPLARSCGGIVDAQLCDLNLHDVCVCGACAQGQVPWVYRGR